MKESQLSMRYSHLAFTFSSLDMSEEACLALVLAIVYDMVASLASEQAEPRRAELSYQRTQRSDEWRGVHGASV